MTELTDGVQCPGWAYSLCAKCACPRFERPRMVAPKGALLDNCVSPWEVAHPEDIREEGRRRAVWMAESEARRLAGGPRKSYLLAALNDEARNIIGDGRHNDQINRSAYKLRRKYVDSGDLTQAEVAQSIYAAAWERGYHRQIVGTIASALGVSRSDVEQMVT